MNPDLEIAQLTLYLGKPGADFDSVLDKDSPIANRDELHDVSFTVGDASCRLYYFESSSRKSNPPWLDFLNSQLGADERIAFSAGSRSPNGLLLIDIDGRVMIATFGRSSTVHLDRAALEPDFGIKVAMNMCGNEKIRQTRTQSNSITPTHIDRQVARPSDTFVFGLSEAEDLRYISAHLKDEKEVTLQGRDSLTIKMIGEHRLSWDDLLTRCTEFVSQFGSEDYIANFPNFRNFQPVTAEEESALNELLIDCLKSGEHEFMDLCIPEFVADDEYAFSFTAKKVRENEIFSYLDPSLLQSLVDRVDDLSVDYLKRHKIFAYSYADDRILEDRHWSIYSCMVFEATLPSSDGQDDACILSAGRWQKVDRGFHADILKFIGERLVVEPAESRFCGIAIGSVDGLRSEEFIFNARVVELSPTSILFDRAKLRIGTGTKNKEFCDVLDLIERSDESGGISSRVRIINSKQYKDASSTNYLFSQAKFYCEAFLTDDVFLGEIREHVRNSDSPWKNRYLDYIKEDASLNNGNDYTLCLWLLYDQEKAAPRKEDMPLLAQYELKLMHDHLQRVMKLRDIVLRFVPVGLAHGSKIKRGVLPAA